MEKFGATTIPTPESAIACRSAASCCAHPVVPTTRLIPRRASAGALVDDRIRGRKIDRDVDSGPAVGVGGAAVPRRHRVDHAGDLAVVLAGELADELTHLAVADQQDAHQSKPISCVVSAFRRTVTVRLKPDTDVRV